MRKIVIPVFGAFVIAAFYMVSGQQNQAATPGYLGDVSGIGTEEDPDARINYEVSRLRDPATGRIPAHMREKELAFAATLPNDSWTASARTTAAGWDMRGPWNVGGRTRALGIDVANENNIIAGSCSGGTWRSADGGKTWVATSPANQYKSVSCLAQDTRPGHTNVWYYGTGEAYGASASEDYAYYVGNGIYKSTDNGVTWSILPSTTSSSLTSLDSWGDIVWNIVTDPSNTVNDEVYAASYGAIYRSTNGGGTWSTVLGTFGQSYFTDVAITSTGVVYATLSADGATKGIFRSADGVTFTDITPAGIGTAYRRIKIGISPSDESQVYFLGNTPNVGKKHTSYSGEVEWNSLWRYTYISGDGSGTGGAWQDRSQNLPSSGGQFDKYQCQGSYDIAVKVKPNDTNVLFIGGTNLYRSTSAFADSTHTTFIGGYDQGASLPKIGSYLNHHPDQHDVIFYPSNPNRMLSANDGGIFYTNDNTVPSILWTSRNNGYLTSMFYACAIDHASTNDIIIAGAQDNGSWFTNSSDLTSPWVTPRGGDGSYCAIADHGAAYYFSIQNGKMMKAKLDNSGRFDSFARIDPIGGRQYQFINPYVIDPNNNNLMYLAGGKFLWRNNDLSGIPYKNNWDSISTNWVRFPDSTSAAGEITAITVSKVPANRVYYACDSRRVFRVDSANVGVRSPRNITNLLFPSGAVASCVAVDPTNADHVMVAYSNYGIYSLFYSPDGGTTWQKAAGNLEENRRTGAGNGPSIRWVSILPVSGGTIYLAGTSVGLFATTKLNDTNTVWVQQGANSIGAAVVDMIDYRYTDGLCVLATHSHGMYSTHITEVGNITGVRETSMASAGYNFRNYPNPFSSETTIEFSLPESSQVALRIYDQQGRVVRVVANERMNAGAYKYLFAANGLPAGMYFCQLTACTHNETTKLMVQ